MRYEVTLRCCGPNLENAATVVRDILDGFKERPWHENVRLEWTGECLVLRVENDFDDDGNALQDEFSDELSGATAADWQGNLQIVAVRILRARGIAHFQP
jgi:hypothetical protein